MVEGLELLVATKTSPSGGNSTCDPGLCKVGLDATKKEAMAAKHVTPLKMMRFCEALEMMKIFDKAVNRQVNLQ